MRNMHTRTVVCHSGSGAPTPLVPSSGKCQNLGQCTAEGSCCNETWDAIGFSQRVVGFPILHRLVRVPTPPTAFLLPRSESDRRLAYGTIQLSKVGSSPRSNDAPVRPRTFGASKFAPCRKIDSLVSDGRL